MADNYLYTANPDGTTGKSEGAKFLIGRVKDIVLGRYRGDGSIDPNFKSLKDLGKIYFEIMYSNMTISNAQATMQPAYPMFEYVKQYPLIGEIVYIVPGPDSDLNDSRFRQGYWYFPPYNLWNSPQHGIFPNMQEYSQFIVDSNAKQIRQKGLMVAIPAGRTFEEKRDVRTLLPFEGDTIIESRHGQSIRFGSTIVGAGQNQLNLNKWSNTGRNGSPIIIIRNGQGIQSSNDYFDTTIEDINTIDSSIWMTSGQTIMIEDISMYPKSSYEGYVAPNDKNVAITDRGLSTPESVSATSMDNNIASTFVIPGSKIG